MKNVQCIRCLKKFNEREIYTIQQFQYRKVPTYKWTKEFLKILEIGEWDSFCEECMKYYSKITSGVWKRYANA